MYTPKLERNDANVTPPQYTQIRWEVPQPGIALITLNRPDRLNAFTATTINEWVDAINCVKTDPALRCLVVTGAGRAFSSAWSAGV